MLHPGETGLMGCLRPRSIIMVSRPIMVSLTEEGKTLHRPRHPASLYCKAS